MALIKCSHCGKETNNKREKCLLCGKEITKNLKFKEEIPVKEEVKLNNPEVKATPSSDTKSCPFCFEEIKTQAIKCKHCQENLTDIKVDKDNIQEGKKNPVMIAFLTIIIFVIYLIWSSYETDRIMDRSYKETEKIMKDARRDLYNY